MLGKIELNNDMHTSFARAQAFMPPQLLAILAILKFLLEEFLCWCTRPVEVFLHRRFGVRGHSLFQTIQLGGAGIIIAYMFAAVDLFLAVFCLAAAVLSVVHRIEAGRHEKNGKWPRHSYSNGEPLPVWTWVASALEAIGIDGNRFVRTSLIARFYEPAFVLGVGIALQFVSKLLGCYLVCGAVAIFVRALLVHLRLVNIRRDQSDARLMASWLASVNKAAAGTDDGEYFVVRLAEIGDGGKDGGVGAPSEPKAPVTTGKLADDKIMKFKCKNCSKEFCVDRRLCGRKGTCKKCGQFQVIAAVA